MRNALLLLREIDMFGLAVRDRVHANISNHANNLSGDLRAAIDIEFQFGEDDAATYRLSGEIPVRDGRAHDGDRRSAVAIVWREGSPDPLRNPHDPEIVVADRVKGCRVSASALRLAFRMDVHRYGYAEHRQTASRGNRLNAGQSRGALPDPRVEGGPDRAATVARWRQREEIRQNIMRVVAQIARPYRDERLDQQPGPHQQDKGKSHFAGDQDSLRP